MLITDHWQLTMTSEAVKHLETAALQEIQGANSPDDLELLRVKYLGRKGALTTILRGLGKLDPEVRRQRRSGSQPG